MRTRLLVVDDQPLLRMGLARIVADHDDIEIVGETSCAQAKNAIARTDPTVVIVGIHTAKGAGCARRLISAGRGVVLVDEVENSDRMLRALDSGFSAYVASDASADEILRAIRHAHVFPGSFAASGLAAAVRTGFSRDSLLSTRERQVLMYIRDGLSSATIAGRLGVSDSSVKTYVTRIYSKLDVTNRSQALVAATSRGLLPMDDAASKTDSKPMIDVGASADPFHGPTGAAKAGSLVKSAAMNTAPAHRRPTRTEMPEGVAA